MHFQNDFNKLNSKIQEVFKNWDNKILPHLPQHMDEIAKHTGALQRKRGVCSCIDLLRILFLYASSDFSFRILAAAACALGISAISDTAWRKHFSKAAPFLREILHSLLSAFLPATDSSAFDGVKNVLLVDTSIIRQDGKQQNQQRIHLCYSLNENRMKQVKVSDQHTAESLAHFSMKKGDLVMADAVYGTAQNLIYAQEQGADVILRITPKNFCLYHTEGEKISLTTLLNLLKKAEETHMEWIDVFGFYRYKGKTGFIRVIAYRLPDEQAAKARKRKTQKASKNQHQIQAETLLSAGWITLVTSLGKEYCGEEIIHLYRSRWQVELLFKRFKQNFSIRTRKADSSAYAETETLLWLIIWTIVERQSFQAECFLAEKQECVQSVYERCKNNRYSVLIVEFIFRPDR